MRYSEINGYIGRDRVIHVWERFRRIWGQIVIYRYGEIQGDLERDNEIQMWKNLVRIGYGRDFGRYRER